MAGTPRVKLRKRNRVHADWNAHEALDRARHGSVLGARGAAREVLRKADPITPFETGELKDSAFINDDDNGRAVVGYTAVHAAKQHERRGASFQGAGQSQWLRAALQRAASGVLGRMASELRSKMS